MAPITTSGCQQIESEVDCKRVFKVSLCNNRPTEQRYVNSFEKLIPFTFNLFIAHYQQVDSMALTISPP